MPWIILIHQLLKNDKLLVNKKIFDGKSQLWNILAIKIFFPSLKKSFEKSLMLDLGNQSRKPSFVPWTDWGHGGGGRYRLGCSSTRALRRKGICWRLDRRTAGEYFCLAYLREGVTEKNLQGVMEKWKNVLWKTFWTDPRSSKKRKRSYTFFPIVVGVLAPSLVARASSTPCRLDCVVHPPRDAVPVLVGEAGRVSGLRECPLVPVVV